MNAELILGANKYINGKNNRGVRQGLHDRALKTHIANSLYYCKFTTHSLKKYWNEPLSEEGNFSLPCSRSRKCTAGSI